MIRVALLVALGLAVWCPAVAGGQRLGLAGLHVAYGIGGAVARRSELRQALDAGITFGWLSVRGSRDGMWSSGQGPLLGLSASTGFGSYPTFVLLEGGWGTHTTLAGLGVTGCLAVRAFPDLGFGAGGRIMADVFALQAGLRLIAVAPTSELQLTFTIGLGRF